MNIYRCCNCDTKRVLHTRITTYKFLMRLALLKFWLSLKIITIKRIAQSCFPIKSKRRYESDIDLHHASRRMHICVTSEVVPSLCGWRNCIPVTRVVTITGGPRRTIVQFNTTHFTICTLIIFIVYCFIFLLPFSRSIEEYRSRTI